MFKYLKKPIKLIYLYILRVRDNIRFHYYLKKHSNLNIIIGSSSTEYKGWFSSEKYFLDICQENDFQRILKGRKINKILAEHVLEHLTEEELLKALNNFYHYSSENVNIRIAVPDGNHPNTDYIQSVKPDENGLMAHGHKILLNYITLCNAFHAQGFDAKLLEYWDDNERFYSIYRNDENGFIQRSLLNDSRNSDEITKYTSLIADFFKKKDY